SSDWVLVTNQSDKEVQLYKIWHLSYMVKHLVVKQQAGVGLIEGPSRPGTPPGARSPWAAAAAAPPAPLAPAAAAAAPPPAPRAKTSSA
ncbi:MAG: hypothetical protein VXZ78_06950, partial [Pseudomonadota bacterium]|nr:hypothetical protein [Pseudomonadota bacterium]